MAVNEAKYIGNRHGNWRVTGVSSERVKGGGVLLIAECVICSHEITKPSMQLKHITPKCPACKQRLEKARNPRVVIITGDMSIVIEGVPFEGYLQTLSDAQVAQHAADNALVHEGYQGQPLLNRPDPWNLTMLADRRAAADRQLIEEQRARESEAAMQGAIAFSKMHTLQTLEPTRERYFVIQAEHKGFVTGEATSRIVPKYLEEIAENLALPMDAVFSFSPAPNGQLFVYWDTPVVEKAKPLAKLPAISDMFDDGPGLDEAVFSYGPGAEARKAKENLL